MATYIPCYWRLRFTDRWLVLIFQIYIVPFGMVAHFLSHLSVSLEMPIWPQNTPSHHLKSTIDGSQGFLISSTCSPVLFCFIFLFIHFHTSSVYFSQFLVPAFTLFSTFFLCIDVSTEQSPCILIIKNPRPNPLLLSLLYTLQFFANFTWLVFKNCWETFCVRCKTTTATSLYCMTTSQ